MHAAAHAQPTRHKESSLMQIACHAIKKENSHKVQVVESSIPHASPYFTRLSLKRDTMNDIDMETKVLNRKRRSARLVVGYKRMKPNIPTESEQLLENKAKEILKLREVCRNNATTKETSQMQKKVEPLKEQKAEENQGEQQPTIERNRSYSTRLKNSQLQEKVQNRGADINMTENQLEPQTTIGRRRHSYERKCKSSQVQEKVEPIKELKAEKIQNPGPDNNMTENPLESQTTTERRRQSYERKCKSSQLQEKEDPKKKEQKPANGQSRSRIKKKIKIENISRELFDESLAQEYVPGQQSLLPSSYPKHFTEQVKLPNTADLKPLNLETEKNVTNETQRLSQLSPSSDLEVFDGQYLYQILDHPPIQTYCLTSLHVRLMSIFLGTDFDYLREFLERIDQWPIDTISQFIDICEQTDPSVEYIPPTPQRRRNI